MILKLTSGLSKRQKYTIIGLLIFTTLSLAISFIVNQANKNSQAAIILPLTGGLVSTLSTKQLSSISTSSISTVTSSSVLSSSSVAISSSSETPKIVEEKLKEELPPEKEQVKFTAPEATVKITPPQKILLKPKAPEVVYEQPKVEPIFIPEPKVEVPQLIVEKIVPVIETPKLSISFSSNSCDQSLVYQLLDLVNDHRVANGSGIVTLAGDLNGVACSHAMWMNDTGTFSHTGKDGTNPYQRCERAGTVCWAENVAYNSELTALNIFELYKNSPGHNKNMINPEYTEIGLAFAGVYNAQVFR